MGLLSSYDITFIQEKEFLRATVAGEFSRWKDKRGWARLIKEVGRRGARKVLIDGRNVSGDVSTEDLYAIGDYVGTHIPFKLAMLRRRLDKEEFGAWIARYRGANIQLFAGEAEAIAWLLKD